MCPPADGWESLSSRTPGPPAAEAAGRATAHPSASRQRCPTYRADEAIADVTAADWQTITWRRGSDGPLTKQFVAVRAHRAVSDQTGIEGWLIGERPLPDHDGDTQVYFSNLPAATPLARLVELAHRRPSIERAYEDGKSFLGLDDYTARKWDSFHHHLAIQMLVLSFLALQKEPIEQPVIQMDPQEVISPNEPVFPLRA
ncbi:MAG: hypothetical protein U0768_21250 [Anaerolineae bacterium]